MSEQRTSKDMNINWFQPVDEKILLSHFELDTINEPALSNYLYNFTLARRLH
jgi:hypothetical protein